MTSTTGSSDDVIMVKKYDRWTLRDFNDIQYGYYGKTGGCVVAKEDTISSGSTTCTADPETTATTTTRSTFYITTAINYTNGPGHMGHAYEAVTSDVIARFQRCVNRNSAVYFVTGSDEHGQKIAEAAEKEQVTPIEICNKYVTGFQVLNQRLLISYDDYIRTTSHRHRLTAQELWMRCANAEDIYLDTYTGWYNIREETFVTDTDATLHNFIDPVSGLPYKRVEEESYFFKMSKYQNQLIEYIETINPNFIQPVTHKNLILQRLKSDTLRDLSISRTTFDWGIPVPDGFHTNHVMYVWMDALSNYLTGVNGLGIVTNTDDVDDEAVTSSSSTTTNLQHFWPANVHIIGKDILWFHTVIWPCLLFSANIPIPQCVYAHGFVNDKDGKKMSKSMGNVVDPHDMLDIFSSVDTFRWYLCKEAPYGGELSFSEDSMRDMHNADLCGTLGNLIHRATTLCTKYCNGNVPDVPAPTTVLPISDLGTLIDTYISKMNQYEIQSGANIAIQGFRDINGYLQDQAPWHVVDNLELQQIIVRATLEAAYAMSHLLLPFLPEGCLKIFTKLGTEPKALNELNRNCRNLIPGTPIRVGDILYAPSISEADLVANAATSSKKESHAEAQARKKEAKAKQIAASKAKQASDAAAAASGGGNGDMDDTNQSDFSKMDIRVGKIIKVWYHEGADKLLCEQIDVGDVEGPREIASGLRHHYTLEEMQDRLVLVVCNLKPAKIVGFTSNGMVLAAKAIDGSKVELIDVPENSVIGERVTIEGIESYGEPYTSTQVKKKKVWETVSSKLQTSDESIATWDGLVIRTSVGPCKAATLTNVPIA